MFDFLGLSGEVAERDMEQALMDRIVETLRELGVGYWYLAEFDPALFLDQRRSVESVTWG